MNGFLLRLSLPSRVSAIAATTFTELVRMKVFYFLFFFALLLIGNSAFMAKLSFQEEMQMLKDVSLGAMNLFSCLLAILGTSLLLPKDIEEKTIYTILSKPVPRYEYLLGKLLGMFSLLFLSLLLMSALFFAVLWLREQSLIASTSLQLAASPPEELQSAIASIRTSTFNENLLPGIGILFLKSAILASMTLLISAFSTSGIFTMIASTAAYFIGHLQATARDFWLESPAQHPLAKGFLAFVSFVFPDLQLFSLSDDIVAGTPLPAHILEPILVLGCAYLAAYYIVASLIFSTREL